MSTYSPDQIANGGQVLAAVQADVPPSERSAASLDAIMAALTESTLHNDNYGDIMSNGQMSSSRGLFQQISAWGPLAQRENAYDAASMFLTGGQQGQPGLLDINGWQNMPPWQAVQAVQQSEFSDGSNYEANMGTAQQFLAQYGGNIPPAAGAAYTTSGTANGNTSNAGTGTASGQPTGLLGSIFAPLINFLLVFGMASVGLVMMILGGLKMVSGGRAGSAIIAAGRVAA